LAPVTAELIEMAVRPAARDLGSLKRRMEAQEM
jgi:hypothetical protein